MIFDILTIFPNSLKCYFNEGVLGRSIKNGIIKINFHNLRKWTSDNHKSVDDLPYGGGAGMIMKVKPIYTAVNEIKSKNKKDKTLVVLLSPKGKNFNQSKAKNFTKYKRIILICGRYEGVDERVTDNIADLEISIGNYVLSGGELAAGVVIDTVGRLLPGVLGNKKSLRDESFSKNLKTIEYPQYTRPKNFKGWKVPEILLSGNHEKIKEWRKRKQY